MNNLISVSLNDNESIKLVNKLYADEILLKYDSVATISEPDSKKIKTNGNDISIHLLTCEIDWKVSDDVSVQDIPVMISSENRKLIISNSDLVPLFSISNVSSIANSSILVRVLEFGHIQYLIQKYNDRVNKLKLNILNLKLNKDKSSKLKLKNDTKKIMNLNKNLRSLRKQLKNIDLKGIKLSLTNNTVKLSLQIWLNCERNHIANKFNKDTMTLLHDLLNEKESLSKGNTLGITSPFIERQFMTQTIRYTKEKLINKTSEYDLHVPHLNTSLLPFQQQSLKWLLTKEGYYNNNVLQHNEEPTIQDLLSYLNDEICYGYTIINSISTGTFFWNKFTNFILDISYVKDLYSKHSTNNSIAKGLLCEEMGLGK